MSDQELKELHRLVYDLKIRELFEEPCPLYENDLEWFNSKNYYNYDND